ILRAYRDAVYVRPPRQRRCELAVPTGGKRPSRLVAKCVPQGDAGLYPHVVLGYLVSLCRACLGLDERVDSRPDRCIAVCGSSGRAVVRLSENSVYVFVRRRPRSPSPFSGGKYDPTRIFDSGARRKLSFDSFEILAPGDSSACASHSYRRSTPQAYGTGRCHRVRRQRHRTLCASTSFRRLTRPCVYSTRSVLTGSMWTARIIAGNAATSVVARTTIDGSASMLQSVLLTW